MLSANHQKQRIDNLILLFDTVCVKSSPTQTETEKKSDWTKTPYANLVRYEPSQKYFARIRVKGKLILKSLKTTTLSVAKLRLADFEKAERARAASVEAVAEGKMTFGDCLEVFKTRLAGDPSAKPKTREYYQYRIMALLESWHDLEKLDVSKITRAQCLEWGSRNATQCSSSSHNHTVSLLRKVFEIAMESGARYDNPGLAAKRVKEHTTKSIVLPSLEQFGKMVEAIRTGGSGFSKPASELVEFLAYGGFRIGEAKHITWADCNFERGEIIVRGDPETGLKGRNVGETRIVSMISDMRLLLERMRADRQNESPETPVMRVYECQKSINRASKILGIKRITHHDLRHLFATRCIESNVDIPTVSRWLGHKDGGALAMKTYGHLRNEHSKRMAGLVTFSGDPQNDNTATTPQPAESATLPPADNPASAPPSEEAEPEVDAYIGLI
jgi:integrase